MKPLFIILLSCLSLSAQDPEVVAEIIRRQALTTATFPTWQQEWQDATGTNPPMVTPLDGTNALVRSQNRPRIEKLTNGTVKVWYAWQPRRTYFLQSRNLTTQTWRNTGPEVPWGAFPVPTAKYFRINEGSTLDGSNFTYRVVATLTNK